MGVGTEFARAKREAGRGNSMRVIGLAAAAAVAAATFGAVPVAAREVVHFRGDAPAGTVVVRTAERRLYYVIGDGRAIRYPVGVGRASKQWTGTTRIDGNMCGPPGRRPRGQARQAIAAGRHPGRLAEQPDGRGRDDACGRRIRDPRHQRAGLDRRLRLLRLHPHVQSDVLDLFGRVSVGTTVVVTR